LDGSIGGIIFLNGVFALELEHGVVVGLDPEVVLLKGTIEGVDETESVVIHREVPVLVFI
jgi:hypothetical protein